MFRYVAAAALGLVTFQPASAATIFDYNVYVTGDAYISGGSYGDVASGSLQNANGPDKQNIASSVQSSAALDAEAAALSSQLRGLDQTGVLNHGQWTPNDRP